MRPRKPHRRGNHPADSICLFVLPNHRYKPGIPTDLEDIPLQMHERRYERSLGRRSGGIRDRLAKLRALVGIRRHAGKLASSAADWARERKVEKIWVILNSVTIMAMAPKLKELLGLPMISLVWDAPEFHFNMVEVDRFNRKWLLDCFTRSLRGSERVGVCSEAFQREYEATYGAETVLLQHAMNRQAGSSAHRTRNDDAWVLGFCGSPYAASAWKALFSALDSVGWCIGGRRVLIKLLSSSFTLRSVHSPRNIEYLGWHSDEAAVDILSTCDALYLPHPFEPAMRDFTRLSFPSKVTSYLAAARPVFIHAPDYSTLTPFFEKYPIGVCCESLEPNDILRDMQSLVTDPQVLVAAGFQIARVVSESINVEIFRKQFARFVGIDSSLLCKPSGSSPENIVARSV